MRPTVSVVSLQPVEREPVIYHLDALAHHCQALDNLPDEFFEVTVDDIRKRFAQLKSERCVRVCVCPCVLTGVCVHACVSVCVWIKGPMSLVYTC